MKKVLFVINPLAGGTDKSVLTSLVDSANKENRFVAATYLTTGKNDRQSITSIIESFAPDTVAVAGGDGTLVLVAELVMKRSIKLAIIPMGSANGMAKELGISTDINTAFDLITTGRELVIDLLSINDRICLHLADVGLNARVVRRFERDPNRGLLTYGKYVLRELSLLRRNRFYIDADGVKLRRTAVSMIFANASRYGTGAVINPVGSLTDGKFELCIIKQLSFLHFLNLVWKSFFGKINESEQVEIISASKASLKARKKILLQADGETMGKVKNINIEVIPSALSVLVPATYFN